ncbi:cysteine synthase A [Corallococcus sp. H22C18031201]|uniref:cysteine synthase A n=1 Tax=Citreicoccus inhibens TaxID=2849499 RepID=UPI000E72F8A6|nr:cysteine synthase A [Citreicoccus inhibens]MBU8898668.1 cysteine synthase A [Citreicoccus inhibens]RJS15966.1 cysteine synthase A [Corallococcus sp. H22C18031201]
MAPRIGRLWDAVGNTPLLRIGSLSDATGCDILGKAEFMNPGGSIKDRAAKGMIRRAEQDGLLKPGGTIVEGTAGNTGIGLGLLGRERGYRVVVTMPDNQAREKYELLEAMGVEVRKVPVVPFANPNHFFHQARLLSEQHGWFWANQFENPANGDFHFETTGPEIWEQCEGRVDVLVASVGSGGSLSGVSRYLKERNPALRVVLVDPLGSGLYCYVREGKLESTGGSITEGIGIMRITENFRRARVDEAVRVDDQAMLEMLYHLARQDALVVGTSAALNVRAAWEVARQHAGEGLRIVTLLCDHGSRYASKVFNPEFLATKQLEVRPLRLTGQGG